MSPIAPAPGVDSSAMARPAARLPPINKPNPTGRNDCDNTSRVTVGAVAPSAMRTPISLARCSTRYDSTLKSPDNVSASARPPSTSVVQNAICRK